MRPVRSDCDRVLTFDAVLDVGLQELAARFEFGREPQLDTPPLFLVCLSRIEVVILGEYFRTRHVGDQTIVIKPCNRQQSHYCVLLRTKSRQPASFFFYTTIFYRKIKPSYYSAFNAEGVYLFEGSHNIHELIPSFSPAVICARTISAVYVAPMSKS